MESCYQVVPRTGALCLPPSELKDDSSSQEEDVQKTMIACGEWRRQVEGIVAK